MVHVSIDQLMMRKFIDYLVSDMDFIARMLIDQGQLYFAAQNGSIFLVDIKQSRLKLRREMVMSANKTLVSIIPFLK